MDKAGLISIVKGQLHRIFEEITGLKALIMDDYTSSTLAKQKLYPLFIPSLLSSIKASTTLKKYAILLLHSRLSKEFTSLHLIYPTLMHYATKYKNHSSGKYIYTSHTPSPVLILNA